AGSVSVNQHDGFFFSSRRRHTRFSRDWSSDVCSSDLFHRHVILGPADKTRAGGKVDGLTARISRNGAETTSTTEVEALTGPLVAVVQRIADTVAGMGEALRAGDVIIAGSLVPAIFLKSDDRELAYALDPIGGVSVSFSGK